MNLCTFLLLPTRAQQICLAGRKELPTSIQAWGWGGVFSIQHQPRAKAASETRQSPDNSFRLVSHAVVQGQNSFSEPLLCKYFIYGMFSHLVLPDGVAARRLAGDERRAQRITVQYKNKH